jgi:hypothetical protein
MSRTPAGLFLLADHREREALAEAALARSLRSVAPGRVPGARVALRLHGVVTMTIAAIVARKPFGTLRREVALRGPIYRWGR